MPSLQDMRQKAKEAGLMKLDRLIATRQHIPANEFPVSLTELCERYEKLYTGCINDVMRELCLLNQNLPSEIMPLRDEMTVCGEAFTVKSAPNVMIEGEMTFRAQMLDEMKPGGLVVWDTSEDTEASLWGGVMTATAISKGIRGAVISRRNPRHEADSRTEVPDFLQVPHQQRFARALHDHALSGSGADRQSDRPSRRHHLRRHRRRLVHPARNRL